MVAPRLNDPLTADELRERLDYIPSTGAHFDIGMELRKLRRQTWAIALSAMGIVVAAFASGAAWWNYLHH
jgi:hypothetical protein